MSKPRLAYFVYIPGGTENVNYAVQTLMSLLVQTEMLEDVFCNRLPPG